MSNFILRGEIGDECYLVSQFIAVNEAFVQHSIKCQIRVYLALGPFQQHLFNCVKYLISVPQF